jgi:hypothetical protein
MKIAIYDTLHEETLATLIRIFSGEEIHVFTTTAVAKRLEKPFTGQPIQWHLLDATRPMGHASEINKQNKVSGFGYIILSTVHQHHLLFSTLGTSGAKLLMVVHDSMSLQPRARLGVRGIARFAGSVLLNRAVDAFFVLSSEVKNHIIENKLTRKPVLVMPGAVWEEKISLNDQSEFIVSIPGTVDPERRDYGELLKLAPLLSANRKIIFVFLGLSKGENDIPILAEDIRSNYKHIDVIYFHEYVDPSTFDSWLKRSHVVYLPLRQVVHRVNGDEYYGKTKISGGFYDAVRFSRIILQPAGIPVAEEFRNQVHTYTSVRDLAEWMNNAISDEAFFQSAQERADLNASRFELEQVRRSVMTELKALS